MDSGLSWSECTGGGKNRTPIQFILSVSYLTPKRRPVAERQALQRTGRSVERGLLVDRTNEWRHLVIRGRVVDIRPDERLEFIDRR